MPISVTHIAKSNGSGVLKASSLKELLDQVPLDANIKVTQSSDQRESFWTVEATWIGPGVHPIKLPLFPPNVHPLPQPGQTIRGIPSTGIEYLQNAPQADTLES